MINPFLFWTVAPYMVWSYMTIGLFSAVEDAAEYASPEPPVDFSHWTM